MPWELRVDGWESLGTLAEPVRCFSICACMQRGSGALITEVPCKEPQKYVSVSLQWVETSSCPSHPTVSFWKPYFLRLPDLSYLRCNCQSGSLKIKLSHWCTCSNFASRASGVTASTPRRWSFPNLTIFKLQAHIRTLVHKNKWVGDWWRKMISL